VCESIVIMEQALRATKAYLLCFVATNRKSALAQSAQHFHPKILTLRLTHICCVGLDLR